MSALIATLVISWRIVNWFRINLVRGSKLGAPDYRNYFRYEEALREHTGYEWQIRPAEAATEKEERGELRRELRWWQSLDGWSFERELGDLLEKLDHLVELCGGAGDRGIDLLLRSGDRKIVVQCKAHGNLVGPGPVRDLYGTVMHARADEGWLEGTRGFSRAARDFAQGKPPRLVLISDLLEKNRNQEGRGVNWGTAT